jgi:hypothetical protein
MKSPMKKMVRWTIAIGLMGLFFLLGRTQGQRNVVEAQTRKAVIMTRLYTGPDGQTHAEEVEAKFAAGATSTGTPTEIGKMMAVMGAELHRTSPGSVNEWHTAPRRQYVITLSGRGEIELAGGKKIALEPGHIELAEDLTGKGHITRVTGTEDRVTLQLPLADQSGR